MNERGAQLLERANGQISELIELFTTRGEAALSLPCAARAKLGDGTVGASALHTADSYLRIAGIVRANSSTGDTRAETGHGEGHSYRIQGIDLKDLQVRLSAAGSDLGLLAELTDEELDSVPGADSGRFCDGHRTLEQVIAGALDHQKHNIDALKAAVA
jgi:hypothetical protein